MSTWRESRCSDANGGDCIEVATTRTAWYAFVAAVKREEFPGR
ncbi:DUF397 domain-containing protein [Streptomyces synnematoformans]|uniref:DUF397 domain-containing protein n=1 Tax=Streptomyces synnematoformans TaxID=415721 RepID=A0ABN2XMW6_9ACTN